MQLNVLNKFSSEVWSNEVKRLATWENAREYANAVDQRFIFCCELFEVSVNFSDGAFLEKWVNKLEDEFDILNGFDHEVHDYDDYLAIAKNTYYTWLKNVIDEDNKLLLEGNKK